MEWRPDGWVKNRNIYMERNQPKPPYYKSRQNDYEAGANAMIETLFELAKKSPTGMFCIDSRTVNIYGVNYQEAIEGEVINEISP